jgi:alpha-amylase
MATGLVALGLAWGCGGKSTPTGVSGVPVSSIGLSPSSATVITGNTKTFSAQPKDAAGELVTDVVLAWSSSDTTVATVDQSGVVKGVTPGTIQIAASAQGINGYATVTTVPIPVAKIVVTPSKPTVTAKSTVQLADTCKDAAGHVLSGRTVSWASDEVSVATVSSTGLVSGVKSGTAHITASSGSASTSVSLTVFPHGLGGFPGLP